MKNTIKTPTILCLLILFSCQFAIAVNAQTKREVLTNTKIIELVNLGLGNELIVQKIKQSECRCDTSSEGLKQLKAAKVSDEVIMAMLGNSANDENKMNSDNKNIGTKNDENTAITDQAKALKQIAEPGIYLFENGKMTFIEPTVFSGSKNSILGSALTYGIKKSKIRAVVRGLSANLQVTNSQPEFWFVFNPEYRDSGAVMAGNFYGYAATSPAEFMLVKMDQKKNSRETVIGEYGVFSGVSTGTPDKFVHEYSFEKVKTGIYKVTPKTKLENGEYCFYYASMTGGTGKLFDFSLKSLP
jgi:hypothetical protein